MKSNKLKCPAVILAVAVLLIAVYAVVSGIAKKPTVTEGEFPFSITYELNGETVTIQDVYAVRYTGNSDYTNTKARRYVGTIGDMSEDTTWYLLQEDADGRIELHTNFYPDYMMGDAQGDYFDDEPFAPQIYYYDLSENESSDAKILLAQGVKLVSFEYSQPLENKLVFSHISILDAAVVFPTLLIALLALLATIVFVKKDQDFTHKPIDVLSVIFNFIIGLTALPFVTVCACLMDITGDNEFILNQIMYFVPALIVFGIAASVALRRKGYRKGALIVEFAGPAVFALILLIFLVLGM